DLDSPVAYELNPGADGKLVLALHTSGAQTVAKNNFPAPAKPAASSTQPKAAPAKPATVDSKVAAAKDTKSARAAALADTKQAKAAPAQKPAAPAASAPAPEPDKAAEAPKPKQEDKKWAMNGKRDPFFSPVVQQNGSGCSTGKKCLEIGNI